MIPKTYRQAVAEKKKAADRKAKRAENADVIDSLKKMNGFYFARKSKKGEPARLKKKIEDDQNEWVRIAAGQAEVGRCFYYPESGCQGKIEVCDHVIAKARGLFAKILIINRVPACSRCNAEKGGQINNKEKYAAIFIKKRGLDAWLRLERLTRITLDLSVPQLRLVAQHWHEKVARARAEV